MRSHVNLQRQLTWWYIVKEITATLRVKRNSCCLRVFYFKAFQGKQIHEWACSIHRFLLTGHLSPSLQNETAERIVLIVLLQQKDTLVFFFPILQHQTAVLQQSTIATSTFLFPQQPCHEQRAQEMYYSLICIGRLLLEKGRLIRTTATQYTT